MNSITKRWLRGSLLITFILVASVVGVFIYSSRSGFYTGAQQAMLNRLSSISGQLNLTGGQNPSQTAANRSRLLFRVVEQFDAKDKFELMLLDAAGQPLATSSGARLSYEQPPEDFKDALESAFGYASGIFTSAEQEHIMAVTVLVPDASEDVAAMRMLTSLTLIDKAIAQRALLAVGVGVCVLLISIWSGLFFVRSIVKPVSQIEEAATAIARGNLKTRLPEAPYDDEIGRLCNTINQMAEELSKTEKLQNEFISSVSHELRTPLTSISGWVETIAQLRDPEDENYRKGLAIIGQEADRLYGMVEELLSFSRLQSGVPLECAQLDLVAELTDVVLFMEARMKQEQIKADYEEPEVLLPVWADPGRLRQVFVNVLDNAIKYSPAGGVISIDLLQGGENVYVKISDQGQGIAPEDLENVKLKFFKGRGAVRGSGIGLAVVDEIMTALNGWVDIDSELGKGTTVTLCLPLYTQHPAAGLEPESGSQPEQMDKMQP